ncbi:hypothetical protein [Priestia megaterium]|uniref:hypothetical protein n=1 Tax=Priestia megaterium TaxID=1404 RepID=UPI00159BF4F7|nr:hypothetical protein [Priestia megaterium]
MNLDERFIGRPGFGFGRPGFGFGGPFIGGLLAGSLFPGGYGGYGYGYPYGGYGGYGYGSPYGYGGCC